MSKSNEWVSNLQQTHEVEFDSADSVPDSCGVMWNVLDTDSDTDILPIYMSPIKAVDPWFAYERNPK